MGAIHGPRGGQSTASTPNRRRRAINGPRKAVWQVAGRPAPALRPKRRRSINRRQKSGLVKKKRSGQIAGIGHIIREGV